MIVLTLILLATPLQDATASPPLADPQRTKCRTQVETGSLVKRTRICRTVAEWRKLDEQQRSSAYRAVDQGAIVSCGECRGGS
jgi:hypothetical protein